MYKTEEDLKEEVKAQTEEGVRTGRSRKIRKCVGSVAKKATTRSSVLSGKKETRSLMVQRRESLQTLWNRSSMLQV